MRVAVVGGTGAVGRHAVQALRRNGHRPVVVARATGVDVLTGAGLDQALPGVNALIDVLNIAAAEADCARHFATATTNLLAAGLRADVRHYVLLSIVGLDRFRGNAHCAGKRVQEDLVRTGAVPFTVMRATQFFDFAGMVVQWTRRGDTAAVPPLLVQPVAAADVGQVLAEIAVGDPQGRAPDLAGPDLQNLVDMARRTLTARGQEVRLVPSWRGPLGLDMAGDVLLPDPRPRIAPTSFEQWLTAQAHPPS